MHSFKIYIRLFFQFDFSVFLHIAIKILIIFFKAKDIMSQILLCTCPRNKQVEYYCFKLNCHLKSKRACCYYCSEDHKTHKDQVKKIKLDNILNQFGTHSNLETKREFSQQLQKMKSAIQIELRHSVNNMKEDLVKFSKQISDNTFKIISLVIDTTNSQTPRSRSKSILNRTTTPEQLEGIVKQLHLLKNINFKNPIWISKQCHQLFDDFKDKIKMLTSEFKSLLTSVINSLSKHLNPHFQSKTVNPKTCCIEYEKQIEKLKSQISLLQTENKSITQKIKIHQQKNKLNQSIQFKKKNFFEQTVPEIWKYGNKSYQSRLIISHQYSKLFPSKTFMVCTKIPEHNWHGQIILDYQGLYIIEFKVKKIKFWDLGILKQQCKPEVLKSKHIQNVEEKLNNLQQNLQRKFPQHNINIFIKDQQVLAGRGYNVYFTKNQFGKSICIVFS